MKVDRLPIGLYDENIYILHEDNKVLIIDPGKHSDKIIEKISSNEIVQGILITHGHYDHVGAVDDIYEHYNAPVYIDRNDELLVKTQGTASNGGCDIPVYCLLNYYTHGNMKIGDFDLTIIPTPGHTSGSVCIGYKNILFTGDTLFTDSIGRTDFFSGSEREMFQSLQVLKSLSNDIVVYPGHGNITSIGREKKYNYYLNL